MTKLIEQANVLDNAIQDEKAKLLAKILPLVEEFTRNTGLLVRSIEPSYIEITNMENPLRDFIPDGTGQIHTDVEVRGISNRRLGS